MTPGFEDLEGIKRCKYRYMRCLDQKNWTEMRDCFTEDAETAYSAGKYRRQGVDAIVAWLEKGMGADTFHSSHRVHQPEIDLTGANSAIGVWAFEDTVVDLRFDLVIQGAGFYEDRYERGDDGIWRIRFTGYKRSFEQLIPRASIAGIRLTASWWTTGGQSELDA